MSITVDLILKKFETLRKKATPENYELLLPQIISDSLTLLKLAQTIDLLSKVAYKEYFAFSLNQQKISRAVNKGLYSDSPDNWLRFIDMIKEGTLTEADRDFIQTTVYSAVISFCVVVDLQKEGDQKTPGTFFEYVMSYIFTITLGVVPQTSIKVLDYDGLNVELPTDKIFNLGQAKPKFHMPIKTSTRERAIMLWAHQKLLDGVYGIEKFMGTPVLLAETKTDKKKREVVEICTPNQWRIYQLYIARLKRVYYLDMPEAYRGLSAGGPPSIEVIEFSAFFFEWMHLTS